VRLRDLANGVAVVPRVRVAVSCPGGKRKIVVEKFSQQLHFVCVKWPKAGFDAISLRKRLEKRAYVNASGSSLWECTVNNLLEVYFHHALGQSVPARYYSTFSGNPLRLRLLFVGLPIAKFFRPFSGE